MHRPASPRCARRLARCTARQVRIPRELHVPGKACLRHSACLHILAQNVAETAPACKHGRPPAHCVHCGTGSPQDAFGLEPQEAVIALCPTALSKRRILVCAPSNAAVDEIVLRVIKSGLLNGSAKATRPKIVRAGVSARMHASVEEVSLDFLVKKELNGVESAFQEVRRRRCGVPGRCEHRPSWVAYVTVYSCDKRRTRAEGRGGGGNPE